MKITENEPIRLSKMMTQKNLCSRREADDYISKGWVLVNNKTAVLGQKVTEKDNIQLISKFKTEQDKKLTIILNKPIGYVSHATEKNYGVAHQLITLDNFWDSNMASAPTTTFLKKLAPAGRLDIDSTGLLILTQDGRIAKKLIGENNSLEKEYLVRVSGKIIENGLRLLNYGLSLDGNPLKKAKVKWQNEDQLNFILTEGKKRQIRRMCELVGLEVIGLKRIRIGKIKLNQLPLGKWRILKENEQF